MLDERGGRRAPAPPTAQSPTDDEPHPPATKRGTTAAANISVATNASTDFGQRAKAAIPKKTTAASTRAAAPAASTRGGRGGRGGAAAAARNAAAKTDLNISVSKTTNGRATAQPSIQNMFGSQSTRTGGRSATNSLAKAAGTRQVTQYISSDSE